ncbi:IS1634 family transposase, partial [Orrella sp. 11846]
DNQNVINYYHDLWNVEQAFRMSKSDLKTRPIFHHTEDSIRAHVLICFMALMVGKLIEIKTGRSIKRIRDAIWSVQEAHVRDTQTGTVGILVGDHSNPDLQPLNQFLNSC